MALFESKTVLLPADKPRIANAISKVIPKIDVTISHDAHNVLDAGFLLQRIPWRTGSSYGDICDQYVVHVKRQYGVAVIVFDGYDSGPSTKDATHIRRTKGN